MNRRGADMGILKRIRNILLNKPHKPYRNKYMRGYYAKTREQTKGYQLKYKFGITMEEYQLLLESQGGTCALCNGLNNIRRKGTHNGEPITMALSVDHNHKTGKVRGLLCNGCNTSLGKFKDNPILLEKAIKYLRDTNGDI